MRNCTLAMYGGRRDCLGRGGRRLWPRRRRGQVYDSSFYNPSLGRSFVPRPSGFGGGVQTTRTGRRLPVSLGRPGGVDRLRHAFSIGARRARSRSSARALGRSNGMDALGSAAGFVVVGRISAAGMPSGREALLPGDVARSRQPHRPIRQRGQSFVPHPGIRTAGGTVHCHWQEPVAWRAWIRSPRLSKRLTRVAQAGGVLLTGRGINVYLSNNAGTQSKGNVRTASGRALLANVLSLEPGGG